MFLDTELIRQMSAKSKRVDDRKMDEYREIKVEKGIITSAAGSAKVTIGNTKVIAGVKIEPGTPFDDTPNEGVLMVSGEFVPLASENFEAGPPKEEPIELSRVVDRAIREAKCIDFGKLCIAEGEKVWMVYVDIDIIDNDGNMIDAAGLAAIAALADAKIPDMDENGKPIYDKRGSQKLPMDSVPISTTFAKIGGSIMADPSMFEEAAMDVRVTVGTVEKGGKIYESSMQKGKPGSISLGEIEQILKMAEEKGKELRKLVLA